MMLCFLSSISRLSGEFKKVKNKMLVLSLVNKGEMNETRSLSQHFDYRVPVHIIKDKLREYKIPFHEGYACYKINNCTLCHTYNNSSASNSINLFINKRTGHFLCHQCKMSGSWFEFHSLLQSSRNGVTLEETERIKRGCYEYGISNKWLEISNQCDSLCDLSNDEYDSIMKNFNLPYCSKQKIQKLNILINSKRRVLYFPMVYNDLIVGYKILDLSGRTSTFPRANCFGFLSYPGHVKSSVVIIADISDFLALISQDLSNELLCLPYGIMTLPQSLLPHFEKYEKVIFWLGAEIGAWHSSLQFAKKLNEKRCFLIRPTENQISATKAVLNKENVKEIISDSKPIWHQFITTFSSLREDVLAEIQNISEISGITWTRFPMLNKILKGHRRGELTVLTGPTGCGKTTFMSEYSLDLAMKGVNTLWGSFEIKNSRLARTMLQQFAGTTSLNDINLFNYWADEFESLPIYFMTFHGQHSIKTVMDAVEHCSYTYDIAHVIIDNVQFMMDISGDLKYLDRFWIQDCILQSFRRFATTHNCHVTLVMHPRKEIDGADLSMNSIFGTAKATQEADNILIIQDKTAVPQKGRKYLQVCKNRFSGDLGIMPMEFDKNSLSFGSKQHQITQDSEIVLQANI